MKNELHIYPTSRIIREQQTIYRQQDGFIPSFMRMDDFINNIILVDNLSKVDMIERAIYLQEASNFKDFDKLKFDRTLVKFFTKSDAIFKFFEELSVEGVGFDTLRDADAYVEFSEHIDVLEELYLNYQKLLQKDKKTDRAFIPKGYKLNKSFIQNFGTIEIFVYGYLSNFELDILEQVSSLKQLYLHIETSKYNQKMLDRLSKRFGLSLKLDKRYKVSLSTSTIVEEVDLQSNAKIELFSVEQRIAQVPLALMQIDDMIEDGFLPEEIVLLLPDESAKEYFKLYDYKHNLNFAMGDEFIKSREYKLIELIYYYMQSFDEDIKKELLLYRIDIDKLQKVDQSINLSVDDFFEFIDTLCGMSSFKDNKFLEYKETFRQTFQKRVFVIKEWIYLWTKKLQTMSIDDINGGKITAMGVLESRGMNYKGVVIVDFNDHIVPTISSKDQFLDTKVRKYASLPTKKDREDLQKHYYHTIIQKASRVSIIYTTANNQLPSRFLYELQMHKANMVQVDSRMFYSSINHIKDTDDIPSIEFKPLEMKWSASRFKVFLECKRKFYYRYIQKIMPKKKDDINVGDVLHKVMQRTFNTHSSYDNAEELYKEIALHLDDILSEDVLSVYHKRLWLLRLKPFIDNQIEYFKQGYKVIRTEYSINGNILGFEFEGIVDRVDQDSTHTIAIDYKTGSITKANRTKNLERLSDFQMSVYHILLSLKYPNVALYFMQILESGDLVPIKELEAKNELFLKHLQELKTQTAFLPQKCEDVSICKYCDYALLCGRGEYL